MEKEVKYFKMIYTKNYDTDSEKSERALLRVYQKLGINELVQDGHPFIVGYIKDGIMYEFFTNCEFYSINGQFVEISKDDMEVVLSSLGEEKREKVHNIMRVMVSDEPLPLCFEITTLGVEISTIDEGDLDLREQCKAYRNGLTTIDPLDRAMVDNYARAAVKKYNRR